jgi:anti-sigma-K factor RskA
MVNERDYESIEELLPAYALGALDPEDFVRVEAYLAAHPEARHEVEELRETLGVLALSAPPLAPPPGAKAALLARVEQLAAPEQHAGPRPLSFVPPIAPTTAPPEGVVRPFRGPTEGPNRRDRGWRAALAAVAAAVILGLTGWNVALQRQVSTVHNDVTALEGQISAQADSVALGRLVSDRQFARPLTSSAAEGPYASSGGPAGYLYADPAGGVALMNCYWMPKLAENQVYQVWLLRADGTRDSGGTFTVDERGNASVVIKAPSTFSAYTSVGVTAEPAGGSTGPTTPRVVWAELN